MLQVSILLFAAAFFLFALSCAIYVAYRFLALALSLDAAFLKEFRTQGQHPNQIASGTGPVLGDQLKDFIASRLAPTEGEFSAYSDESAFINEQVDQLRSKGLTEDELNAFIRQAVGTDIGKTED